jgi:Sap, sulfolipid-1-addressing protein
LLPVEASWGSVLGKLIPIAAVIALSPITIIPAVLVLHAPRPRPASLAFLGGWVLGLAALTALFVSGSGMFGGLHKAPPTWASWLRVVLGTALIALGLFHWFTRHRHSATPRWMRSFSTLSPARAGAMGVALAGVRPEVIILCLAAGLAVGNSCFSAGDQVVAAAIFVGISASTVAIPILGYVAAGDRLDNALERLKVWMQEKHGALLAITLVLIGLLVFYNGIRRLA